jgi:phosphate transport system substrate-binding protein
MKQRPLAIVSTLVLVLVVLTPGCGSRGSSQEGGADILQGTIAISGAWALYPMMVRWGEEFQKQNPRVKLDISAGGAGKGMADALAGAVDIGMVSRDVTKQEEEQGAFWVPVTRDAVFPTVNEKNPVLDDLYRQGVTREKFIGIYITGEITSWGQVVDRPEVKDPIHVYTRSDAAGAPEVWAKYLGKRQEDLLGVGVYGDPGVMEAVVKDRLGIGYNNMGYAFDMATGNPVAGARVVPIDANSNGKADVEEVFLTHAQAREAVAKGLYGSPLARDLNLVTKGKPAGLTKALIVWILTDGQAYVGAAGYVALPKETIDAALSRLD